MRKRLGNAVSAATGAAVEDEDGDGLPHKMAPRKVAASKKKGGGGGGGGAGGGAGGKPGKKGFLDDSVDEETLQKKYLKGSSGVEAKIARREAAARSRQGQSADVYDGITITALAESMKVEPVDVVKSLMKLGESPNTTNDPLPLDVAQLIVEDFGLVPEVKLLGQKKVGRRVVDTKSANLAPRPPIVTIMGHVDHGKTSLLDFLRSTSVAEGEAGGITQKIAAFTVRVAGPPSAPGESTVTFFDTPGHAAFAAMRVRGASIADVIVLVISLSDGVQPQTVEVVKLAKEIGVPLVVALTKADRGFTELRSIALDLQKHGVTLDTRGIGDMGDAVNQELTQDRLDSDGEPVPAVAVSVMNGGSGVAELVEMVQMVAELHDCRGDPTGHPEGVVVESRLSKGLGMLATVLVQSGTLRVGQWISAGGAHGRVRRLFGGESGEDAVEEVGPGQPVTVAGLRSLPPIGADVTGHEDEAAAKAAAELRAEQDRAKNLGGAGLGLAGGLEGGVGGDGGSGNDLLRMFGGGPDLGSPQAHALSAGDLDFDSVERKVTPVVMKVDVAGSAEAIVSLCRDLKNEEVGIRFLRIAVGPVSSGDVEMANTSGAVLVAFNVPIASDLADQAQKLSVPVASFDVVYRVEEFLRERLVADLPPNVSHRGTGLATVLKTFVYKISGEKMMVAGLNVTSGRILKANRFCVIRAGQVVHDSATCYALKVFKKDVQDVARGAECVVILPGYQGFEEGDIVMGYETRTTKRKLEEPFRPPKPLPEVFKDLQADQE